MSLEAVASKKEALHPQHGQHGWISQHCGPRESSSIVQMSVCLNEWLRSELTKLRPTGQFPKKRPLFRQCSFEHGSTVSSEDGPACFPFASDENRFDPGSDQ